MTINTGNFTKALWPGINKWYGKAYSEYPVEWEKLFDKNTSSRAYEEDVGLTSFGLAKVKPEGAPIEYDTERQGFTTRYQHVVYALGFMVTREIFDDDLYDVVGQRKAQGLAFSMRQTKEVIGANVYNRAFNSSYIGGDGVSLLNAAHPNVAGGTWSNVLSTASDISEAAFEQMMIDISFLKNDRGLTIAVRPESLIIHPSQEFEASRILKSEGRPGGDLNDINALKSMGAFPKGIIINHFLTDQDAWFVRTNIPDGMKYFERNGDSFDMDNDFDSENAKFKARARYSFGWTDPRCLYGSPGA